MKNKIMVSKNLNYLPCIQFGLKYCLPHGFHANAIQEDMAAKTVPLGLHHTVEGSVPFLRTPYPNFVILS